MSKALTMNVELTCGYAISHAIKEAVRLSQLLQCNIEFEHNDSVVKVWHGDTVANVLFKWNVRHFGNDTESYVKEEEE